MGLDKFQGSKVSKWADRNSVSGTRLDTATYIGIVKNNVDSTRSGRLEVWIPDFGGSQADNTNENNPVFWRTVSYASPFFGTTYIPDSNTNNTFTNTNQTYGMWFVPPDIGNQVLCTFVNGDPDRGYWFACINPTLSHYMVPAIAASDKINRDPAANPGITKSILPENNDPPQRLPVTEFNENAPDAINDTFINNQKPIHEFQANVLFKQGLDRDKYRGAISSSSQRESPSRVFGFSTPGRAFGNDPADDPEYQRKLEAGEVRDEDYAVKVRKGGHTFVMDDGDITGKDQLVRIRTAGGHQIMMNDSEKLMYIANSEGSVWIELAASGHMHIYTAGGFNLHTEGDFNVHAGRSINMHAEGSINLNATADVSATASRVTMSGSTSALVFGGRVNIGSGSSLNLGASTLSVTASGALELNGGTIDINGGSEGGSSITGVSLQQNTHSDTGFDETTNLWIEKPATARSITTVMPQHEPWTRSGAVPVTGDAPVKVVDDSACPPKGGSASGDYSLPQPNSNNLDRGKFRGQPTPWTTDTAFLNKVKEISATLNLNWLDMLAIMHLETAGQMDPWIQNSAGYTGLIQFGKLAAQQLNTTVEHLRGLDRVQQCDWVTKYFQYWKRTKNLTRFVDMYLAVLWPAGIGRADDYVIFPAGSREYQQNPVFDPGKKVGYTTVGMVAATIAPQLDAVKQALANAGAKDPGTKTLLTNNAASNATLAPTTDSKAVIPRSGNEYTNEEARQEAARLNTLSLADFNKRADAALGKTVSDGSGTTVKAATTSNTTAQTEEMDPGIKAAVGVGISNTCPGEYLSREDAFNPPGGIGDGTPKFNQLQAKAMMAELGYFESQWKYDAYNAPYLGKYQIDAGYLAERGYIKQDAIGQYGSSSLENANSWAGKDKITDKASFGEFKSVQDEIQFQEFQSNYTSLKNKGGIKETDDICIAAGMLFVAHQFRSVDRAIEWRKKGGLTDARGQKGEVYFNHGRHAIDVLAAGATTGGGADTGVQGKGGENTTGIQPDDVFVFQSSGSGTRARFDALSGDFKNNLLRAAEEYKTKTNSKITITSAFRSQEEQSALYDAWVAAGGKIPGNPVVNTPRGRIFTPAKNVGSHGGYAIDSPQAEVFARTVDLAKYNLFWGGNFRTPDKVHIQAQNSPKG
jgi:hypothetical protein